MYQNLAHMTNIQGNEYYTHYMQYLQSIALQLFKWENLPSSIDVRFLEIMLHFNGRVGIINHPKLGFVASQGSEYGTLDIYGRANQFQCVSPSSTLSGYKADVFNYLDEKILFGEDATGQCVVVYNNDFATTTIPSLKMFANDLAHVKQVTRINVENQKTPFYMFSNDKNLMSVKKLESKFESDLARIHVNEKLDLDKILHIQTPATYVADKLNEHLSFTWNEVMTFLGIANNNQLKKERMIVDEVNGNNEQTKASENIYLKSREEACEKINALWGLNVSVHIRTEMVEQIKEQIEKDVI